MSSWPPKLRFELPEEEEKTDTNFQLELFDLCVACGREMSATLDAYYGNDPTERDLCATCRAKHQRGTL